MLNVFKNRALYERMWKNILQSGRPQMTVQCMHIACWIPKGTNTQWENVILTGFSSATIVAGMHLSVNVIRTVHRSLSISLFLDNEMHFWISAMIFVNTMSNCGADTLESMNNVHFSERYCVQIITSMYIVFPFLMAKRWTVHKVASIYI
jgi:hypothetical protein